jgi:hypothetical protein
MKISRTNLGEGCGTQCSIGICGSIYKDVFVYCNKCYEKKTGDLKMKKFVTYKVSREEIIEQFCRKNNIQKKDITFTKLSSDGLKVGVNE